MKHALTIDLEDAHNIGMYDLFGIQASPSKAVVRNTMRILEILGAYNVRATFFVLGEVARTFPSLIRLIADQGHEIGVHGYHHIQFFRMNPKRAFEALSLAKKEIEQISGYHVLGHRAPAFSVRPDTAWVLETLAEVGFKYDSSIVPCKGRRYGWPGFPKDINVIKLSGGETIVEAPLSTINLLGKNIPVCGGGYLRHFPFLYTRWAIRRVEKKRPAIVYIHPYDIDLEPLPVDFHSQLKNASIKNKIHMALQLRNRCTVEKKLNGLCSAYSLLPLCEVIDLNIRNLHDLQVISKCLEKV